MSHQFKTTIFILTFISISVVVQASPLVKTEGRNLLVDFDGDGQYEPFMILGVGYSPIPIGSPGMQWGETNIFDDEQILRRDFQLLYDMHANSIRIWKADNTNNSQNEFPNFMTTRTLDIANEYGLKVIPGFWINLSGWRECQESGRVFVWDENFFDLETKTVRASVRADILNRWQNFVNQFKGRPEILFWAIGNENNIQLGDDEDLVRAFYGLINDMAQLAHNVDPDHPVAFIQGGIETMVSDGNGAQKNIFDDDLAPDVDIWGVNMYPGQTFGNFFDAYAARSEKPLWISEFGVDAWHSDQDDPQGGYEDQETQAAWVGDLWDEIFANDTITIGGTVMEYADEWWKPDQWLCQKPGWEQWWRPYWELLSDGSDDPCGVFNDTHDLYGIGPMDSNCDGIIEKGVDWFPAAPDAFFNEEWWGIMAVQRNLTEGEPDVMVPRLVYGVLQEKFLSAQEPHIIDVSPSGGQSGDEVVITGKNFGTYQADDDYDPLSDMTHDGIVDLEDFMILYHSYNRSQGQKEFNPVADITQDGVVNFDDFAAFVDSYKKSANGTYVSFDPINGPAARVINWNDTEIRCSVPSLAETGSLSVHTSIGQSNAVAFNVSVPDPIIVNIVPGSGVAGQQVVIQGSGFGVYDGSLKYDPASDFDQDGDVDVTDFFVLYGAYHTQQGDADYDARADLNHDGTVNFADFAIFVNFYGTARGEDRVVFGGGQEAKIISWNKTQIVCEVPFFAETGGVQVLKRFGQSNVKIFIILQ